MTTNADRILANLPPTFAPLPRPTAISALADAFGGELLQAENTLAAMMFAHWVDYADANGDVLADLTSIAKLYGLAPRDDETIEGFRQHLKRYILTFLEGTVTVRGICRVVAEALGLVVADDQLDAWWSRQPGSLLTTVDAAADDAATLLFGVPAVSVRGAAARPATFVGSVDLSRPVDLRGRSLLSLTIDGADPVTFDLAAHLDPASADIGAVVGALGALAGIVAEPRGGRLAIRSATAGAASTLGLGETGGDAAQAILGIAPRDYAGTAATRAQITGTTDLATTLDMTTQRYLRLVIDESSRYEIDCSGAVAAATTAAEVVAAIHAAAGPGVAALAGQRLIISSPTPGLAGTVALLTPTTSAATRLLFGDADTYARGRDAAPARVSGAVDLSAGVDLSQRADLAITVDAAGPLVVNCAGAIPQKTTAGEIARAINAAFGAQVAAQNGLTVTLTSGITGPDGRIRLGTATADDALDLIFGFAPRRVTGAGPVAASFTGTASLAGGGADLRALRRVQVSADDAAPVIVDFAAVGLGRANVTPAEITAAIDAAAGVGIASTDGTHITLGSSLAGEQGSVAIVPIETTLVRAFVSRAFPIDEASTIVLGTSTASAQGSAVTRATLTGGVELHDGLDLRGPRFLAIALDGAPPRSVDVTASSARAFAVLLSEIVQAIDAAFRTDGLASVAGDHLVLTSPTSGSAGSVSLSPGAGDAAPVIFGLPLQVVHGSDARRVIFTGLTDLSQRVDLSAADRVHLVVDGIDSGDVSCAGGDPAHTSAAEITGRINAALGGTYATTDGTYLQLSSALAGQAGSIAFLAPAGRDATLTIFGIAAGRTYHGDDATPAVLTGTVDLPAPLDLSAAPLLRLAVDDLAPVLIDCRGSDPPHIQPAEIAANITKAFGEHPPATATVSGGRLVVTAASTGAASRIAVQAAGDKDASATLFGTASSQPGADPTPATLTGTIDLRTPVDLAGRSILRLAVDGARPVDIDLAGAAPDRTFGDEIAGAIEAALPGVASIDPAGHLVLSSPAAGEGSRLDVLPLRPIEVVEYPPCETAKGPVQAADGAVFPLDNDGAAEATVTFGLFSAAGLCGVDLIGLSTGVRIHVDAVAAPGAVVTVAADPDGSVGAIAGTDGTGMPLPPGHVVATPQALAATVPFAGTRPLARSLPGARPSLALVDPLAQNIVLLESVAPQVAPQAAPSVRVTEADPSGASSPPDGPTGPLGLAGRLHADGRSGELRDASGARIAGVRAPAAATFAPFEGQMVTVRGTLYQAGAASLLAVETIARLFDVEIGDASFPAVTLDPRTGPDSLTAHLAKANGPPLIARDVTPADALRLPPGRSDWLLVQCDGAHFDAARFDRARFAGGPCDVPGIFDVGRFNAAADQNAPGGSVTGELARFAPFGAGGPVSVTAAWQNHQPGAFTVNLPADLPATFGARFNAARFTTKDLTGETYNGVVLDPPSDAHFIKTALSASTLVSASDALTKVPLGWDPQPVPFRQPRTRRLSGGRTDRPSAIYLQDSALPGQFFPIFAKASGTYGDDIAITVQYAGPAASDISVSYPGARFECGREIALTGRIPGDGAAPPPSTAGLTGPGPIGVLQAKAAGIGVAVTRDRTYQKCKEGGQQ